MYYIHTRSFKIASFAQQEPRVPNTHTDFLLWSRVAKYNRSLRSNSIKHFFLTETVHLLDISVRKLQKYLKRSCEAPSIRFSPGLDCFCFQEMKQKHVSGLHLSKQTGASQSFSYRCARQDSKLTVSVRVVDILLRLRLAKYQATLSRPACVDKT